jgi:hypothetical protein
MTSLQDTAMGGGAASTKTASYVLVAADAGTTVAMNAAGATTITVNTGLFAAGDTVFIQNVGAGVCTITAGTATVDTAGALALPQYDAGILYFTSASAAIFYDYIQVGAASPLTTKGDLYTFSTSDTRLGVGANGTVLTAASGEATGLEWATPATGGGMTLISTTAASGGSVSLTSIAGTFKHLLLVMSDVSTSDNGNLKIQFNSDTTATRYRWTNIRGSSTTLSMVTDFEDAQVLVGATADGILGSNAASLDNTNGVFWVYNYTQTLDRVLWGRFSSIVAGAQKICEFDGFYTGNSAAVTSIQLTPSAGTFSDGDIFLYGVA